MQETPQTSVPNENIDPQVTQPVEAAVNAGGEMSNNAIPSVKKNNKWLMIGGAVALVFILLGVGTWYFQEYVNVGSFTLDVEEKAGDAEIKQVVDAGSNEMEEIDSELDTATIKDGVYKNTKYGFSFKYPEDLITDSSKNLATFTYTEIPGGYTQGDGYRLIISTSNKNKSDFSALFEAEQGVDVKEAHHANDVVVEKIKNLKIGPYDAVEYIYDGKSLANEMTGRGPIGISRTTLVKINDDLYFNFSNISSESIEEVKAQDKVYYQILSTFEFINQDQQSNKECNWEPGVCKNICQSGKYSFDQSLGKCGKYPQEETNQGCCTPPPFESLEDCQTTCE